MSTLYGVHFPNFQYFDPTGVFPGKPAVRPGISDAQLFDDICQKMRESGTKSIKILLYTYKGDPNRAQWVNVQHRMVAELHNRFPQAALILRLAHKDHLDPSFEVAAAQMAQDFQPIINNITNAVQDAHGQPAIWLIVGNEPNHPDEGFSQDRAYFNSWFKAVVWHFWNTNPIPSHYDGGPHGIFYPGLSPNFDAIGWYADAHTQNIIHYSVPGIQQCWCNGAVFHVYWQTGHLADLRWGEYYKQLWTSGIEPVNPFMPIIIGEWGNSSPDDMDTVKTPEYLQWLKNLSSQHIIPPSKLVATSGYIVDGTDDWRVFWWTHHLAQSIGTLGL